MIDIFLVEGSTDLEPMIRDRAGVSCRVVRSDEVEQLARLRHELLIVAAPEQTRAWRELPDLSSCAMLACSRGATTADWQALATSLADEVMAPPFDMSEFEARGARALARRGGAAGKERRRGDRLTGLLTQAAFLREGAEFVDEIRNNGCSPLVVSLRINNLMQINARYGDAFGDQALRLVAGRLTATAGLDARIARLNGSEFAVIERLRSGNARHARVAAYRDALAKPCQIAGEDVDLNVAVEIASAGHGNETLNELLARARVRPNETPAAPAAASDPSLVHDLARAIDSGDLCLQYQPHVSLHNGASTSFEAFLRWRRDKHGLVMPSAFLPAAEAAGLDLRIDNWVLRHVAFEMQLWAKRGAPPVEIAINIGIAAIASGRLHDLLVGLLRENAVDLSRLTLELSCANIACSPDYIARVAALRGLGVRFTLDAGAHPTLVPDCSRQSISFA